MLWRHLARAVLELPRRIRQDRVEAAAGHAVPGGLAQRQTFSPSWLWRPVLDQLWGDAKHQHGAASMPTGVEPVQELAHPCGTGTIFCLDGLTNGLARLV